MIYADNKTLQQSLDNGYQTCWSRQFTQVSYFWFECLPTMMFL